MSARRGLAVVTAAIAAVVALVGAVRWLDRSPTGPLEPAWDRERCAHCRMAVSDPRFAAQIQTAAGEVLFFDDPGCLLAYEKRHAPAERAVYFHHVREARWMPPATTAFLSEARTPMNWGLAAVDAATPGAVSVADARAALPEAPHVP